MPATAQTASAVQEGHFSSQCGCNAIRLKSSKATQKWFPQLPVTVENAETRPVPPARYAYGQNHSIGRSLQSFAQVRLSGLAISRQYMQHCPNRGAGELKIIVAILEVSRAANGPEDRLRLANSRASVPWRPVIEKILAHLGLVPQPPPRSPARAPGRHHAG